MPSVDVWNLKHERVGTLDLADEVFGQESRSDLIWEVVTAQMASRRRGTASTKTRSAVSGTGKKPFRQKGSGRARQGTLRAPQHRGGGVAFGPHPHSQAYRAPRQVRRQALRSALSEQAREKKLFVVHDFNLAEIKTKKLAEILKTFGLAKGLLVDGKENLNLRKSAHNLANFTFRSVAGVNLVELLRFEHLVISEASIRKLEEELRS